MNSGQPNTTPDATIARLFSWGRVGSGARAASRIAPAEDRGERLAPDADEGRVELLDRHARGRQREAEGEHAEEAEEHRHGVS